MLYSPVIIPTLNRYEHFKRCLESLEKCTGAENTTVFIGLDYPPSEKYIEGWKQIDNYLCKKENNNIFAKLVVFRRASNCGVGGPNSNTYQLVRFVREKYESYIFSEDDNIFSPNFLEYINIGLVKFKNDERIYSVNGYCHPYPFHIGNANYFLHNTDMSAWGYGIWSEKDKKYENDIRTGNFLYSFDLKKYIKIRKSGLNRAFDYLIYTIGPKPDYISITDNLLSIYAIANDLYFIVPTVSKVRNEGWDGSGCNCNQISSKRKNDKFRTVALKHITQNIDMESTFEFLGEGKTNMYCNNAISKRYSDGRISYPQYIIKLFCLFKFIVKKRLLHL